MFPDRTLPTHVRSGTPRNPVVAGFAPDPSVCRVGDVYYLVTSTFEYVPSIALWTSSNLTDWTLIGAVLAPDQLDLSDVPDSGGIYAPTIHHHKGAWYVVVTVVGGAHGTASYLVTTRDPEGRWDDPVRVEEAHGIDPSLLFDDGAVWWVASDRVPGPEGTCAIWLRELDLRGKRLVGPERTIWHGAARGARWVEAPHLYRVGEWYHLITAEGGTELSHAVVVARSRNVTGPYEGCPANPVLTHRHLGASADITSVGHADLVEAPDGTWWAVCLGTRRVDGHHLLGRETFLVPVIWEGDWPVLSPGVGRITQTVVGPMAPRHAPEPSGSHDFRDGARPGPEWLAVRRPAAWTATPWGLLLEEGLLGLRLRHREVDVVLTAYPDPAESGSVGLLLRQSDDFQVRLQVGAEPGCWRVQAVCRRTGVDECLATAVLPGDLEPVVLTASLRGLELTLSVEHRGSTLLQTALDARALSTETAGGFVGTVAGPFAENGGQVLVERMDYLPREGSWSAMTHPA